ncbi:hypothetical protein B046DRAFT_00752 [Streptomyces sp. LamerLS-316]|uniref:DUF7144 family membrane protein n=1 Tax=unclassified Streptomyces TaxID=2593676 RepID=UPI0008237AA6|nr:MULTISPECIES: hypothetical protein [unclassified Streptomyces]MYQ41403.1 hypothetical protein [Streptomyces sp. SID4921]SCK10089.1 hypothetical protein B046DRAFT_00752 [Streptomyces sp. LamerLS-316]
MAGSASDTRAGQDTARGGGAQSGWTVFAAVMMIFGGAMAILEGIAAIAKDDLFVSTRNYVFQFSLAGWGWVHLILGIVVLLAGFALFSGALWARAVGVLLAGLLVVAHFLWLPYYPFWSLVLIAINIFVIWALCVGPQKSVRA